MSIATTFPDALSGAVRGDRSRPLVTFYDDATGERVELSLATYANWVAKTAGLVQDEVGLERGDLVLLDLPTHWLGPVWLGAAWSLGVCATDDAGLVAAADLVVCGPDRVAAYAAGDVPVVALSLRPLGGRFTDELPMGVTDYGAVVLAQPDAFTAIDPPRPDDPAWRDAGGSIDQAVLVQAAGSAPVLSPGGRLLTDVNPCTRRGLETLTAPLLRGGGTVWVRHADEASWPARADQERVTEQLRD